MELTEKQVRQLAEDRIMKCYGDGYCDLEAMINLFVDGYSEATRQINDLSLANVRLSFDEIFHFNCWMTKNNWYEACDGEYDNHETPNKCIRLTYEQLHKVYINEA